MSISNGSAPEYGEAVERALCDLLGLEYVDGEYSDARTSDGQQLQIKGTQRWVDNGGGDRTRGRVTVWSDPLLTLIHNSGEYLVALYDPDEYDPAEDDPEDVDAEAFILAYKFVSPEAIGEAAAGSWIDGHRPSKGQKGRFRWCELEAFKHELETEEPAA